MKTHDRECFTLAWHFLADYQLSPQEHREEGERLARAFQVTAEAELESLEHRRKA